MGSINTIFLLILALCCFQSLNHLTLAATNTLNQGDRLNTSSTLVSEDGNFTLGFFATEASESMYLGIWNTKADFRKVWVANPERSVNVGGLTIDNSGTIKVISGDGNTLFNLSDQVGSGNTRAVLRNNGNFVLLDVADNRVLWESFNHPTDTLLPGMKLGFNLTSRQNWTLTSWLSDDVPTAGAFTLSLERFQDSGQLNIRIRGEDYWTSGPWINGNFQLLPEWNESSLPFPHNMSLVSDDHGMYFTFWTPGTSLSMIRLTPGGKIYDVFNFREAGAPVDFCYGYGRGKGCTSALPNCRGNKDSFKQKRGDFRNYRVYDGNASLGLSDCWKRCWNDCNCTAFATISSNGTGCMYWNRDSYTFISDEHADFKYLLESEKSPESKAWIWILVALAIFVVLLLAGLLCYLKIRRCRLDDPPVAGNTGPSHQE